MARILVTNDDGIDSPALPPLLHALRSLDAVERVEALVPDRERSWIAKAITRFEAVRVTVVERDGIAIHTSTAFPADCANLGIHSVFDTAPDLVVSGINVGLNHGSAYLLGSGTIGAAAEASIAGIPAVAVSMGPPQRDPHWHARARSSESASSWERAAHAAARIVGDVLEEGLPPGVDLLNVNIPEGAGPESRIEVTELLDTHYGPLFQCEDGLDYRHTVPGWRPRGEVCAGCDHHALTRGVISATPIQLARSAALPDALRRRLERELAK